MSRANIIKNTRRVVIKIGSGVLTTGQGLDIKRVEILAGQISRLASNGRQVVVVSSGAIASGQAKVNLGRSLRTVSEKQAAAAMGQSGLMKAYEDAFAAHGREVAQILLTASDLVLRMRYQNARSTFRTLLDWNIIPIVNENDTISVAEIKLGDNDNLAAMLTNLLGAGLLINLTNVDGIMDADPRTNPRAKRIARVETIDAELLQAASSQPGAVGRGGVLSKVRAAATVARCGAHTIVANGLVDDILDQLAQGCDAGTLFLPRKTPLTSRKHWIAFTAAQEGELAVDQGAVKPLVERGKSLLAAGIVEVRGSFGQGESVRVVGPDGAILGVGLCNYSSEDLDRIKGLRTNHIDQILGKDHPKEVIHRDNLVVFDLEEEESVACLLKN